MTSFDNWHDPYPTPIISEHDGIYVVRDDLLESDEGVPVGSKVRGLDYLIGHDVEHAHITEWVFGSCPSTGYAQVSLPYVCRRYGKKAVLFMAQRSMERLHPYQSRGLLLGAEYHWVEFGMLSVTAARAKAYAAQSSDRRVLPIGLEHKSVLDSFALVARQLAIVPDVFWTVGSSGTLNRALQQAWPYAEAHVVEVGHVMSARERGRATVHRSPYKFNRPSRVMPPFPSAPEYDAKAWAPLMQWHRETRPSGKVLFWNVGA